MFPTVYQILIVLKNPFKAIKRINKRILERQLINAAPNLHQKALVMLKEKKNLCCVFYVVHHQVWKYDYLYKMMCDSPRFTPVVLICPIMNCDDKFKRKHMSEAYRYFQALGYNVMLAYNVQERSYIDVNKDLNPDIVFYTNPYEGLIDDRFYIKNFMDKLTIYVPYAFVNNKDHHLSEDLLLRNLVWRCYVETKENEQYSKQFSRNKGRNVVVTGYPGVDKMIGDGKSIDLTKLWKKDNCKKIIWAPHHTIKAVGHVHYSCFLKYADFMLQMAAKYSNEICFVFKPHPMLREKLYKIWGEDKTDLYYKKWQNMPNTSIHDDDYVDLFLTSDAMIHDCGSFIAEYLYARKPVMRMMNDIPEKNVFNDFTIKCLNVHYKAYNEDDIEHFLQNVINEVDPLKDLRNQHYVDCLLPPHEKKPSENIFRDIIDSIDNQVLYRNYN